MRGNEQSLANPDKRHVHQSMRMETSMPFGFIPKTCFFLLPLLYVWFWCSTSQHDTFPLPFSSCNFGRVDISNGTGIISISKNTGVEESNGIGAIIEESNGDGVKVTNRGGSKSIGAEGSPGPVVISSRKSMGLKESDASGVINKNETMGEEEVPLTPFQRIFEGDKRRELDSTGVSCVISNITDICVVSSNVRIDTRTMVVHLPSQAVPPMRQDLCTYTFKYNTCLPKVTPVEVVSSSNESMPACDVNHQVPAVVFTSGGFATNLYHDFNDIIIPLFLTSRSLHSRIRFVVSDFNPMWVKRYRPILAHLSAYDPIYASQDNRVHCFPGAVVGLKYHSGFTNNASKTIGGYSVKDFTHFLHDSYHLKEKNRTENQKPTLVLISRTTTRRFLNQQQLVSLAQHLGFHVTVATPKQMANLETFAEIVHTCDVLVGIHGAGMKNLMFLREGSVLVQVVPLGLEWGSKTYYGDPALAIGINYLEYKTTFNESSLSSIYSPDHQARVDPPSIFQHSYQLARSIYLDAQNVRIDLNRFRETLLQAMQLIRSSAS